MSGQEVYVNGKRYLAVDNAAAGDWEDIFNDGSPTPCSVCALQGKPECAMSESVLDCVEHLVVFIPADEQCGVGNG